MCQVKHSSLLSFYYGHRIRVLCEKPSKPKVEQISTYIYTYCIVPPYLNETRHKHGSTYPYCLFHHFYLTSYSIIKSLDYHSKAFIISNIENNQRLCIQHPFNQSFYSTEIGIQVNINRLPLTWVLLPQTHHIK